MGKQFKKVLSILLVLIIFQQFTLSASIPLFRGQVYAETRYRSTNSTTEFNI